MTCIDNGGNMRVTSNPCTEYPHFFPQRPADPFPAPVAHDPRHALRRQRRLERVHVGVEHPVIDDPEQIGKAHPVVHLEYGVEPHAVPLIQYDFHVVAFRRRF